MLEIIWDLFEFCKNVCRRWGALLTGGVIAVAWLVYCQCTGKNPSMKVFYWIAGLTFLFACFGAWREQYLKNKIENLRGDILQVGLGDVEELGAWITIVLRITNAGLPTTAVGFLATVKSGEFCKVLQPMSFPENTAFVFQGTSNQIKRSEMLHEKLTKAIPQGESVTGYLVYITADISGVALNEKWPEITIHWDDASGKRYTAKNGEESDNPLHMTGIDDPFRGIADTPRPIK